MADKREDKKDRKPKPKALASPVGFIIVIFLIAAALSNTSWGKKLLQDSQTATTTDTYATTTVKY